MRRKRNVSRKGGTFLRIFVISDTHGKIDKAVEIFNTLQDIDLIVHLGDHWNDAKKMKDMTHVPLIALKGNMDGSFDREGYQILDTDFGKIFLAHGHMENVKQSYETILYKAESLQCRAVFFGHTHIPVFYEAEGIYLLNPGSLSLPVGGRKGSYAIATIEKDYLSACILFENILPPVKTESGSLKSMLNDSDRF
jgi:putative phosphoesterase